MLCPVDGGGNAICSQPLSLPSRQTKRAPLACALPAPSSRLFAHSFVPPTHTATLGFIRVDNGNFVDEDCREFYVAGYNTWQVREEKKNPATLDRADWGHERS